VRPAARVAVLVCDIPHLPSDGILTGTRIHGGTAGDIGRAGSNSMAGGRSR
jgi:hypothetical protein